MCIHSSGPAGKQGTVKSPKAKPYNWRHSYSISVRFQSRLQLIWNYSMRERGAINFVPPEMPESSVHLSGPYIYMKQ